MEDEAAGDLLHPAKDLALNAVQTIVASAASNFTIATHTTLSESEEISLAATSPSHIVTSEKLPHIMSPQMLVTSTIKNLATTTINTVMSSSSTSLLKPTNWPATHSHLSPTPAVTHPSVFPSTLLTDTIMGEGIKGVEAEGSTGTSNQLSAEQNASLESMQKHFNLNSPGNIQNLIHVS